MLQIIPGIDNRNHQVSRRDVLRLGSGLGIGGLSAANLLQAEAASLVEGHRATAKNCIYLYLWGGPPHQDMWDMKPTAPEGIRGEFQPINTNVPGIEISEILPRMAQHADKYAIIRSMSHGSNIHHLAIHHTLMGKKNSRPQEKHKLPHDHPAFGSTLHRLLGGPEELPASVIIPRVQGFGEGGIYKGFWGGLLGTKYDPYYLDEPGETKNYKEFKRNFKLGALNLQKGLDETRVSSRRDLLGCLEAVEQSRIQDTVTRRMQESYDKAYSMLSSDAARRAFDLSREPAKVRERYGWNEYGQSFLLARRLIEAGVRLTSVLWFYFGKNNCLSNVWDAHGGTGCVGGVSGFKMLKSHYLCPPFDQAYSALLEDLEQRGMLDETLVVAVGEFGRTPQINKAGGRDHWGMCYSSVLAGGGIRGGQVYGSSDKIAAYVKDKPVSPDDLGATLYHAFGLPPETEVYDNLNRPVRISEGQPVTSLFG
jgi:hypothetical protein